MKPAPLQWNTLSPRSLSAQATPADTMESAGTVQFSASQSVASRWDERNEAPPTLGGGRPDEKRLKAAGYTLYPIGSLTVLNNLTDRSPDPRLSDYTFGAGGFDVVCSGTFIYEVRGRDMRVPAGPIMRRGRLDGRGVDKGQRRGAVATLADGTIRVARTGGSGGECTVQSLQSAFGSPTSPVVDLCGGGALLIERGARVGGQDLYDVQRFESGAGGFKAPQLRNGLHLAIGIHAGSAWLIVAHSHDGQMMQDDLYAAGFGSLVVFDGGSGGFLRDHSGTPYQGRDVQGFGIKLRR